VGDLHVRVAREMRIGTFSNAAGRLLRRVVEGERHDLLYLLAAHAAARGVGLDRLLRVVGRYLDRLGGEEALTEAERLHCWAVDARRRHPTSDCGSASSQGSGSGTILALDIPVSGPERRVRRRSYFG
jgi:hypothetical protein